MRRGRSEIGRREGDCGGRRWEHLPVPGTVTATKNEPKKNEREGHERVP